MLDSIGLAKVLNIQTSASMLGDDAGLLHSTSIRFRVFVRGRNYRGNRPSPMSYRVLASYVEDDLHGEPTSLTCALIVPLGASVENGLACPV